VILALLGYFLGLTTGWAITGPGEALLVLIMVSIPGFALVTIFLVVLALIHRRPGFLALFGVFAAASLLGFIVAVASAA